MVKTKSRREFCDLIGMCTLLYLWMTTPEPTILSKVQLGVRSLKTQSSCVWFVMPHLENYTHLLRTKTAEFDCLSRSCCSAAVVNETMQRFFQSFSCQKAPNRCPDRGPQFDIISSQKTASENLYLHNFYLSWCLPFSWVETHTKTTEQLFYFKKNKNQTC